MTIDQIEQDQPLQDAIAAEPDGRQFTLRDLFVFTTSIAAACGLAVWQGTATLTYSLGMLLSLMNVTGRLAFFQTRRKRPRCFYVGWSLLIVSLFLPAMKGCNSTLVGWQTAWATVTLEVDGISDLFNEDGEQPWQHELWTVLFFGMLNLANLCLILSPLLLLKLQQDRGRWMGNVFALCSVTAWFSGWGTEMLVGYYVWGASFAVILFAHRIRWPTFAAMSAIVPAVCLLAFVLGGTDGDGNLLPEAGGAVEEVPDLKAAESE